MQRTSAAVHIRTVAIRRLALSLLEIALFTISGAGAMWLRFDFYIPRMYRSRLIEALMIWIPVKMIVYHIAKLDRGRWRYVSAIDFARLGMANIAGSTVGYIFIALLIPSGLPKSIYALDFIICSLCAGGGWGLIEMTSQATLVTHCNNVTLHRTLIYGAGNAGMLLLKELRYNPTLAYRVIGFLDDAVEKQGLRIGGVQVLGSGESIATLVRRRNIHSILIAIPSATGNQMSRILRLCHEAGIPCKTVPGLAEMIEGNFSLASRIRDVAVEDVLGRTQVRLDDEQIRQELGGKIVLVTGAAGSIGSELCRQIARFQPRGIVGFEIAESPLFDIDREMRQLYPQVPFHPELGSIQDCARLDEVFLDYMPQVVYHAAAYKHVPLMEAHVFEAIRNNIFGTYNVARAAVAHGVEDLVIISSDKAVRPTNVMGATKRIAEMIVCGTMNGATKAMAVRFGNVLGSNGSVLSIFKKQIAQGGPLTVTHPDMRRFFMTIPEACQLVLQASAIGENGQICVLDMGEPVRIVDLAKSLIQLSGLKVDEDIKIEFTGIRPGEKLYEELSYFTEDTVSTQHDKIRIFTVKENINTSEVLASLRDICERRDVARLVIALKEIVLDYNASNDLLKRALLRGQRELQPPNRTLIPHPTVAAEHLSYASDLQKA